jgi:hypothetical protein
MPPSRKPPCQTPTARPRDEDGTIRTRRLIADATDAAQDDQLPVAAGESGEGAADRHDADADREDQPFADPVHEPAGGQGESDPHHGERADDGTRRRFADAEVTSEDGQGGRHDAEAQRDEECDDDEHPHLAGQRRSCRPWAAGFRPWRGALVVPGCSH